MMMSDFGGAEARLWGEWRRAVDANLAGHERRLEGLVALLAEVEERLAAVERGAGAQAARVDSLADDLDGLEAQVSDLADELTAHTGRGPGEAHR